MHLRDRLIIGFTVLLLIVGPYLTYKMVEAGMNEDIKIANTLADSATSPADAAGSRVKQMYLPAIVVLQVVTFIVAQAGMVIFSALLIRQHKRRLKRGFRN